MSELGLHKSGTNTNDATAVATDILNSKTAYVKGAKVTGIQSLANLTSSANATASDIISGKSGYVNGVKVTGNIPIQGTQVATPYNTDAYGNFGMIIPASGFYGAGSILYAQAAAAGITPEKILQGQSILGVAGNALGNYAAHCHTEKETTLLDVQSASHVSVISIDLAWQTSWWYNEGYAYAPFYCGDDIQYNDAGGVEIVNATLVPIYKYQSNASAIALLNSKKYVKNAQNTISRGVVDWTMDAEQRYISCRNAYRYSESNGAVRYVVTNELLENSVIIFSGRKIKTTLTKVG